MRNTDALVSTLETLRKIREERDELKIENKRLKKSIDLLETAFESVYDIAVDYKK